jgi:hypothetical protein
MFRNANRRALPWLTVTALVCAPTAGLARGPKPGDVQTVEVITVSLAVGPAGKEIKRVTYAPPPGWYVRGHRVRCQEKSGLSTFTVNTLPREWAYVSEEQVKETYRALLDVAGSSSDVGLKAKLVAEQERTLAEVRRGSSSHHVLVLEATARGEGWLRGGGTLSLTVTADLVYVGTAEDLARAVADASGR